ncbi:MAG: Gfo/Idh/MocA family protein [Nitratireductor sp.]
MANNQQTTKPIGIGIIGGGYMGKVHSVAYAAVGAVFNTKLRPRLEMICASSDESAQKYRSAYGFNRATSSWKELVHDDKVEAVVIATPQSMHREIALEAFKLGKPVFCEKPLGASIQDARAMEEAATKSGQVNMIGFNYIRTPACQFARKLISEGHIGDVTYFRGEHTEDFDADPQSPISWRSHGVPNGTMGDLSPHMINATLALIGNITSLSAITETVFKERPDGKGGSSPVTNDDQGQFMCRFENGAMGHLFFSRVATGKKMGYIFEVTGTKGAIQFDMEDQNAIWLYKTEDKKDEVGFRKIIIGPEHPDYVEFCLGPGHGTGFQDQIIIEARDFLSAVAAGKNIWPSFKDGVAVSQIVTAAIDSAKSKSWVDVKNY